MIFSKELFYTKFQKTVLGANNLYDIELNSALVDKVDEGNINAGLTNETYFILKTERFNDTLYVSTINGFYKKSDDEDGFSKLNIPDSFGTIITDFICFDANNYYLTILGGGVVHWDGNTTFTQVNTNLSTLALEARSIVKRGTTLVIATDDGVWETPQASISWVSQFTGVQTISLSVLPDGGVLAGTNENGLYVYNGGWTQHSTILTQTIHKIRWYYSIDTDTYYVYLGTDINGLYRATSANPFVAITNLTSFTNITTFNDIQGSPLASPPIIKDIILIKDNTTTKLFIASYEESMFQSIDYGDTINKITSGYNFSTNKNIDNFFFDSPVYTLEVSNTNFSSGVYDIKDGLGGTKIGEANFIEKYSTDRVVVSISLTSGSLELLDSYYINDGNSDLQIASFIKSYRYNDLSRLYTSVFGARNRQFLLTFEMIEGTLSQITIESTLYGDYSSFIDEVINVSDIFVVSGRTFIIAWGRTLDASFWEKKGGIYEKTTNTGLTHNILTSVAVVNENIFVGTLGGGVFKSQDFGETWTEVNTDLTNLDVRSLVYSVSEGLIYVGHGNGTQKINPVNTNWLTANLNSVNIISLKDYDDYLIAGSEENGLYIYDKQTQNWDQQNLATNNIEDTLTIYSSDIFNINGTDYLFISSSNYVYRSELNLTSLSFINITQGLGNAYISGLTFDEQNEILYASSIYGGMFQSFDIDNNFNIFEKFELEDFLKTDNINGLRSIFGSIYILGFGGLLQYRSFSTLVYKQFSQNLIFEQEDLFNDYYYDTGSGDTIDTLFGSANFTASDDLTDLDNFEVKKRFENSNFILYSIFLNHKDGIFISSEGSTIYDHTKLAFIDKNSLVSLNQDLAFEPEQNSIFYIELPETILRNNINGKRLIFIEPYEEGSRITLNMFFQDRTNSELHVVGIDIASVFSAISGQKIVPTTITTNVIPVNEYINDAVKIDALFYPANADEASYIVFINQQPYHLWINKYDVSAQPFTGEDYKFQKVIQYNTENIDYSVYRDDALLGKIQDRFFKIDENYKNNNFLLKINEEVRGEKYYIQYKFSQTNDIKQISNDAFIKIGDEFLLQQIIYRTFKDYQVIPMYRQEDYFDNSLSDEIRKSFLTIYDQTYNILYELDFEELESNTSNQFIYTMTDFNDVSLTNFIKEIFKNVFNNNFIKYSLGDVKNILFGFDIEVSGDTTIDVYIKDNKYSMRKKLVSGQTSNFTRYEFDLQNIEYSDLDTFRVYLGQDIKRSNDQDKINKLFIKIKRNKVGA
jgi:hypothetical protein